MESELYVFYYNQETYENLDLLESFDDIIDTDFESDSFGLEEE